MQIVYDNGVYLPEIKLWIDPQSAKPEEAGFVSHGHADHARWHGLTLCSSPTLRFMQKRSSFQSGETKTPAFFKRFKHEGAYLTLLPAGHIAGSAQLLVEYKKDRLLYSGEFKMRPDHASEALVTEEANQLIVETSFGKPEYLFPPASRTYDKIARFCKSSLRAGQTPALFANSLGKSQALLLALKKYDLEFVLHSEIADMCDIYKQLHYDMPVYSRPEERSSKGCVLLWPQHQRHHKYFEALGSKVRTALISGWAIDPAVKIKAQVDEAFPISDHADFSELISYVWQVSPEKVYTHHGFAKEFASHLRRQGKEAYALGEEEQLELI